MHVQYEKEIYSPSRGEDYILYSTVVSPPVGSYSGLCTVQYTLQRSLFLETHILDSALYSVHCTVVSLPGSSYSGLWTVQWSLLLGAHILESVQYMVSSPQGLIFWTLYCTIVSPFLFHILDSEESIFQCCGAGAGGVEILCDLEPEPK